ncbi:MAG: HD domain-containing protein, partial [Clostridia bacterium]|nr:HD domain-containing protein [Clostridia bacterium]
MAPLFGLEKEEEEDLQRAALLHDLTHEKSFEEQQALFTLYGMPFTEDDRRSPAVVHQITGALVALDRYGVSPRCASAIACHTTGKEEMTLFEKLLCLADYVEEGRAYPSCIALRKMFYGQMPEKREERLAHLDRCMLIYFENTVAHLEEKGGFIHPQTIAARNFLKTRRKDL